MNYKIKMMNSDVFTISSEVFNKLAGKTGLVYLQEIGGIINLNSVSSILPEELANNSSDTKKLHDGTVAIKKFGIWYNQLSDAKIDLNYYPELKYKDIVDKDKEMLETSDFAKKLASKF